MKISKRSSDNRGSMKKLFFRVLYSFIGSALMLFGGFFLYVCWMTPFRELRELIFMLIGVTFMASGFWMVYRLAYKPRDKMEISTRIATIAIIIAWFATVNFIFPHLLSPPGPAFYLTVFEVDYEPERYFVLDEEMETYPLFRLALDKMEAEGTSRELIEITREEMKTREEMIKVNEEMIKVAHNRYFKYEGNFYMVSVISGGLK